MSRQTINSSVERIIGREGEGVERWRDGERVCEKERGREGLRGKAEGKRCDMQGGSKAKKSSEIMKLDVTL